MSDNSKRKTWPSKRRGLKWRPDLVMGRSFQEAVAGHGTRRSRKVVVVHSTVDGRWLWGEFGRVTEHPSVETEAEAKRLVEEKYEGWKKTA